MVQEQIGFLCSLASKLTDNEKTQTLLKSYYLMRCKDISRGFGLPAQHFSAHIRCPNCCIEWDYSNKSKVRPMKLSKGQRRRRKLSKQSSEGNKNFCYNQLESFCFFCKNTTVTPLIKPERVYIKTASEKPSTSKIIKKIVKKKRPMSIQECKKIKLMDAYSNSHDVFSLNNENNSLQKEQLKVIKNSKKKKDKFAGLCQQAVLSAAKQKKDKLSLFLKPSS